MSKALSIKILRNVKGTVTTVIEVAVNRGAVLHRQLMGEHYITLPFSTDKPVYFRLGDYCDITGFGLFELTADVKPTRNRSTDAYDYELQLDATYLKWKNKKCKYNPRYGGNETTFSLTTTLARHAAVLLDNIRLLGERAASYKYRGQDYQIQFFNIDSETQGKALLVSYTDLYITDALDAIAKAYDVEWWVEDNIIYIGRCEMGTQSVALEYGENVESMTPAQSSSEYATRIIAFGSDRNLPPSYRKDTTNDVVVNGVVERRLALPLSRCPNGYIQSDEIDSEEEAVEQIVIFDDVYPRTQCVVERVETYESNVENEDGTTTTQTFYRLYDKSGFAFSEDYILDGKTLRIRFTSGSMNGMEFDCYYDEESKYYEVVVNEDYGRPLPDDVLHPSANDVFVLYNWDATKLEGTNLIQNAENELYEKALQHQATTKIDPNTYTCVMHADWAYNNGHELERRMGLGQKVKLVNRAYFLEGRSSRIIGYEIKLDYPYDGAEYTVGESAEYSVLGDLESRIESITYKGNTYIGIGTTGSVQGGSGGDGTIYVIKRYDSATPTDYNVFSAKRALSEFVSKQNDDIVGGSLTFLKSFVAQQIARLMKGATFGNFHEGLSGGKIDENGDTELNELIVRVKAAIKELQVKGDSHFTGNLMSEEFTSGFLDGKGWAIFKQEVLNALGVTETKYTAEFDNLIVRGALRIFTLVVSQLLGENDNRIFTAMLEVDHYDYETGTVYLDTMGGRFYNPFRIGDYIMVQQYNGMPDSTNDYYITKHYECVITEVGHIGTGEDMLATVKIKNFVSSDGKTASQCIAKGDTFTRVDNETDADRKGFIQIMTVGNSTPYIDIVQNLKTNPDESLRGRIGNLSGINHYLFGQMQGFGEYLINLYAVGDFRLRRTGESLDAKVEMLRGLFATQYQLITYEMRDDDNYLSNATFLQNLDGWAVGTNRTKFLSISGKPLMLNGIPQIDSHKYVRIEDYDGRNMLHIRQNYITQANTLIRKPGTHKEYEQSGSTSETTNKSKDVKDKLYLNVRMLALTEGKLTVGFAESEDTDATKLPYVQSLIVHKSNEWQTLQYEGTWNGKGYFILQFTGEAYVSMLSLTDKPLDEFKKSVSTQIQQTAQNILILGSNINATNDTVTNLGIELRAADKEIRAYIDTSTSNLETRLGIVISDTEKAVKLYAEQWAKGYTDGELKNYYTKSQIDVTVAGISSHVTTIYNTLNDVSEELDNLHRDISACNTAIDNARNATKTLEDYVNGAFSDGIISDAERISIEKYLNVIQSTKNDIDATYNELSNNKHFSKTSVEYINLANAKTSVDSTYTALVNAIRSTIADDKATDEEIKAVNTAFANFNASIKTYEQRVQEANEEIQSAIKIYADGVAAKVWEDAQKEFGDVRNEINDAKNATDNLRNYVDGAFEDGVLTEAEIAAIEKYLNILKTEGKELEKEYTEVYNNTFLDSTEKAKLKTAYDSMVQYRNALIDTISVAITKTTYDAIMSAKKDVDTAFTNYSAYLSAFSQAVEVAYKAIEAALKKYADGVAAKVWEDAQKEFGDVRNEINDAKNATDNLRNYVDGAFEDGVLTEAEIAAIEKYLNILKKEAQELEKEYSEIYGNIWLASVEKTKLQSAYNAMVSSRNTLIARINTALTKTKYDDIMSAKALVDSAFTDYNGKLAAFSQAVEIAYKAIEAALKEYVDTKAEALEKKAKQLAEEAARAETYTQGTNPFNGWPATEKVYHVGAVLNYTGSNNMYSYVDASGTTRYFVNGKKYRYIGSDGSNKWECIDDISASTSYVLQTSNYISSVIANFNADGSISNAGGSVLSAYGNKLWAKKETPTYNILTGTATNDGWTQLLSGSTGYYSFTKSTRQFYLYNQFPINDGSYTASYYNVGAVSPVMKLVSGQKYVLSFNYYKNTLGTLHVQFSWGASETSLAVNSSDTKLIGNFERYSEYDDGSYLRYYVIFTARNSYLRLQFINQLLRSEVNSSSYRSYIYLRKIQLERAVNTNDADIRPSEYKDDQNIVESLIHNTAEQITLLVSRTSSVEGRISTAEARITVTESNISQTVKKDGIISAINQSAESIKIKAEKILLEGCTTINNSFRVEANGVTHIGGFKVSGNGLTNQEDNGTFSNDAYIILRNDTHKCFVGIGPNVMPVYSSARALGRFEIEDQQDWWDSGYNIALMLSAKNASYNNFAFMGNGNGVLDGFIAGYKYSLYTCSSANVIYDGYVTLKTNNKWIVRATANNSGVALPKLTALRRALGISTSTNFCVELTISADLSSPYSFTIYGRNKKNDSSGKQTWNTDELPLITHWDNGNWDTLGMGQGDTVTFWLVYDSTRTYTVDGYSTKYTARIVNRQD